ncbi:hypothetical protein L209DRAFT_96620 [Thermothelomyces heterothallicus CBS 203.75]
MLMHHCARPLRRTCLPPGKPFRTLAPLQSPLSFSCTSVLLHVSLGALGLEFVLLSDRDGTALKHLEAMPNGGLAAPTGPLDLPGT